jgi:hypothetical protein
MRFKKLIAAGGAFLLVVGASTLGAAAAYADDAPAPDTTVVEPAPEPIVEPAPEPAPEPVVEPAPEPVVETPSEPATEPVVEPTTDPVESDAPSTESDSDPPADTSTESSTESSDSGDTGDTTAPSTFTRTTATLKTGFAEGGKPEDTGPPEDQTNNTDYWEGLYPGTTCYKDDTTYGSITNDGKAVTLVAGTYEVLIVKSGSEDSGDGPGNKVYENPVAGTAYFGPLNNGGQQGEVSHWIVCLGEEDEDIVVSPAAQGSDQTCERDTILVGGSIQLTLITGVTYTITGPDPAVTVIVPDGSGLATGLEPGDYNVSFVLDPGYTTSVVSPIVITIDPAEGECGEIGDECEELSTAPASLSALTVDETECEEDCPAEGNSDGQNNSCLPDVYLCHATTANPNADNDYNGLILPIAGALGHAFPPPAQDHDFDIIPPFYYYENGVLTLYPGLNWDPSIDPDSEFWHNLVANDCVEQE